MTSSFLYLYSKNGDDEVYPKEQLSFSPFIMLLILTLFLVITLPDIRIEESFRLLIDIDYNRSSVCYG